MKLLIVEDDKMLGASLSRALERAGYAVTWVTSGDDGLIASETDTYEVVLLDLGLPGLDGVEVLRAMRARRDTTPVIVLTARDRTEQKIAGLDAGADDYIVKPFDLDELLARIRARIRRQDGRETDIVRVADIAVDLSARSVTRAGAAVTLTAKEFKVLAELVRRLGRFVSKGELEASLYDDSSSVESNTVEVAIYALRRKLGASLILTVRGLGYMIGSPA